MTEAQTLVVDAYSSFNQRNIGRDPLLPKCAFPITYLIEGR
jgi:hypothetical protein